MLMWISLELEVILHIERYKMVSVFNKYVTKTIVISVACEPTELDIVPRYTELHEV